MPARSWLLLLVLLLWPALGLTANLTDAQYQLYHDDVTITHASEFAAAIANNDWATITTAYNALQTPTYWCWKTALNAKTIYEETDADGGLWDWATHMSQTQQERAAWDTMFFSPPINPSLPQTRAAFTKIYSGNTAQQNAQKAHLLAISREPVRRIEALLIKAGSGDGSPANPSVRGFQGTVTYADTLYAVGGGPHP